MIVNFVSDFPLIRNYIADRIQAQAKSVSRSVPSHSASGWIKLVLWPYTSTLEKSLPAMEVGM